MSRLAGLCLGLWLVLAGPAAAQEVGGLDFDAWNSVASEAEAAVEAEALSNAEFEELRAQIADWRTDLLDGADINADRIDTLQSQIDALGPAPEEGTEEPDSVANRRAELEGQLAEARAPGLEATEAFNRADGLISEIDAIINERQTEFLFEADPPPVNPLNWGTAFTSFWAVIAEVQREIHVRTVFELRQREIRDGLPLTLGLLAMSFLLLARGRAWTLRATERVAERVTGRGRETLAFMVSFTQLLLPFVGLMLFGGAIESTGILGPYGSALLADLIGVIAIIFVTMWLAGRLYPRMSSQTPAFHLPADRWPRARGLIVGIGAVVGLTRLAETFTGFAVVDPAARGVLMLPIYVILAVLFVRFSRMLRIAARARREAEESPTVHTRILQTLTPALQVAAVIGPVLAAAGYLNAAEALMVPTALTLALFGIVQALQVPIRDLYAAISRKDPEEAGQALIPVLVNFVIALASVPLLALIWGARPSQLSEIYARANEGFALGDGRITPGTILSVIVVFAIGLLVTRLLQGALKTTVLPRTQLDTGARNALSAGVGYVGIALAALLAINAGGIDLTALAFVLSALSVGIGFGLQNVVSNFVAGIILLIERPISEGDWIEVNGQMGIVKDISVRSTRIETFDKTDVIVPNADFISGSVTNWTRGNNIGRAILTVGVAYGTDTRRVAEILRDIANDHPGVASYPAPGIDFLGFGADSLDFRIRAILRDVNELLTVKTEINHQIAERFAAEGIEIPFAQRDIWIRNPETLVAREESQT